MPCFFSLLASWCGPVPVWSNGSTQSLNGSKNKIINFLLPWSFGVRISNHMCWSLHSLTNPWLVMLVLFYASTVSVMLCRVLNFSNSHIYWSTNNLFFNNPLYIWLVEFTLFIFPKASMVFWTYFGKVKLVWIFLFL